jgi:hypothetical protein
MSFQQQPVVGYQQQQAKYQPPDPIVQVDYRSNNAYPLQPNGVQQHPIDQQQQYPEALFRRWIPGDERQDYYMDIPTGPPPTFTSLGTFDDPVLVGEPYARRVSLDRRRAENHR